MVEIRERGSEREEQSEGEQKRRDCVGRMRTLRHTTLSDRQEP